MYYIGVDLGGTKLAVGVVGEDGVIIEKSSAPTGAHDPESIASNMARVARLAMGKAGICSADIAGIGVGVPGTVDRKTGMLEYANNLEMENVMLADYIRPHTDVDHIVLVNDANAAAYAEYALGAGRGCGSMIMITLGTGIGAGIVVDGELYEGVNYAAGELGHTTIKFDGKKCACGRRGCYELYASTSALIGQARDEMKKSSESKMWELCGGDDANMDGMRFFDAVRAGDTAARRVLDDYIEYVAVGVLDVVNVAQPELICIGGGISREHELLIKPLRERVTAENYSRLSKVGTRIEPAVLGNDAGIIGAALLAKKYAR